MVKFACPHCGQKISVPDEFAGQKGKCPKCSSVLNVPASSDELAGSGVEASDDGFDFSDDNDPIGNFDDDISVPAKPAKAPGEGKPKGPSAMSGAAKPKSNKNVIIAAAVVGVIVLGGIAFLFLGGDDDKKTRMQRGTAAMDMDDDDQPMSQAEILERRKEYEADFERFATDSDIAHRKNDIGELVTINIQRQKFVAQVPENIGGLMGKWKKDQAVIAKARSLIKLTRYNDAVAMLRRRWQKRRGDELLNGELGMTLITAALSKQALDDRWGISRKSAMTILDEIIRRDPTQIEATVILAWMTQPDPKEELLRLELRPAMHKLRNGPLLKMQSLMFSTKAKNDIPKTLYRRVISAIDYSLGSSRDIVKSEFGFWRTILNKPSLDLYDANRRHYSIANGILWREGDGKESGWQRLKPLKEGKWQPYRLRLVRYTMLQDIPGFNQRQKQKRGKNSLLSQEQEKMLLHDRLGRIKPILTLKNINQRELEVYSSGLITPEELKRADVPLYVMSTDALRKGWERSENVDYVDQGLGGRRGKKKAKNRQGNFLEPGENLIFSNDENEEIHWQAGGGEPLSVSYTVTLAPPEDVKGATGPNARRPKSRSRSSARSSSRSRSNARNSRSRQMPPGMGRMPGMPDMMPPGMSRGRGRSPQRSTRSRTSKRKRTSRASTKKRKTSRKSGGTGKRINANRMDQIQAVLSKQEKKVDQAKLDKAPPVVTYSFDGQNVIGILEPLPASEIPLVKGKYLQIRWRESDDAGANWPSKATLRPDNVLEIVTRGGGRALIPLISSRYEDDEAIGNAARGILERFWDTWTGDSKSKKRGRTRGGRGRSQSAENSLETLGDLLAAYGPQEGQVDRQAIIQAIVLNLPASKVLLSEKLAALSEEQEQEIEDIKQEGEDALLDLDDEKEDLPDEKINTREEIRDQKKAMKALRGEDKAAAQKELVTLQKYGRFLNGRKKKIPNEKKETIRRYADLVVKKKADFAQKNTADISGRYNRFLQQYRTNLASVPHGIDPRGRLVLFWDEGDTKTSARRTRAQRRSQPPRRGRPPRNRQMPSRMGPMPGIPGMMPGGMPPMPRASRSRGSRRGRKSAQDLGGDLIFLGSNGQAIPGVSYTKADVDKLLSDARYEFLFPSWLQVPTPAVSSLAPENKANSRSSSRGRSARNPRRGRRGRKSAASSKGQSRQKAMQQFRSQVLSGRVDESRLEQDFRSAQEMFTKFCIEKAAEFASKKDYHMAAVLFREASIAPVSILFIGATQTLDRDEIMDLQSQAEELIDAGLKKIEFRSQHAKVLLAAGRGQMARELLRTVSAEWGQIILPLLEKFELYCQAVGYAVTPEFATKLEKLEQTVVGISKSLQKDTNTSDPKVLRDYSSDTLFEKFVDTWRPVYVEDDQIKPMPIIENPGPTDPIYPWANVYRKSSKRDYGALRRELLKIIASERQRAARQGSTISPEALAASYNAIGSICLAVATDEFADGAARFDSKTLSALSNEMRDFVYPKFQAVGVDAVDAEQMLRRIEQMIAQVRNIRPAEDYKADRYYWFEYAEIAEEFSPDDGKLPKGKQRGMPPGMPNMMPGGMPGRPGMPPPPGSRK